MSRYNGCGWRALPRLRRRLPHADAPVVIPRRGPREPARILLQWLRLMALVKFVWADEYLHLVTAFRACWYCGRYGGGKTYLAFLTASWLLANGYVETVVSNVPSCISSPVPSALDSAAIVLDESWQYISTRRDVLDYAAFLRKFDLYLLLPSVFPVHRRLSFLKVQRVINGYNFGVPLWIYRWDLSMSSIHERGYFGVLYPHRAYGMYDTLFVPGHDAGISDALRRRAQLAGYSYSRRDDERGDDVTDEIESVADDMSLAADSLVHFVNFVRKKK